MVLQWNHSYFEVAILKGSLYCDALCAQCTTCMLLNFTCSLNCVRQVGALLRSNGAPFCLFGEGPAERRDRLKDLLSRLDPEHQQHIQQKYKDDKKGETDFWSDFQIFKNVQNPFTHLYMHL